MPNGFLSNVLYALDTPGALARGLLAGRPGQRATGRDVLRLGPNKAGFDPGDVPGFLVDILTDPLTWLGGAGLAKVGKMAAGAMRGAKIGEAVGAARFEGLMGRSARTIAKAEEAIARSQATTAQREAFQRLAQRSATITEERLRRGGDWIAEHYQNKLSPQHVTFQNVVNPVSGMKLWRNPQKGMKQLRHIAARESLVAPSRAIPESYAAYEIGSPLRTVHFNPELMAEQTPSGQMRTGVHEYMHALTEGERNLNDATRRYIEKAVQKGHEFRKNYNPPPPAPPTSAQSAVIQQWMGEQMRLAYLRDPTEVYARIAELRHMIDRMPAPLRKSVLGSGRSNVHIGSRTTQDLQDVLGGGRMIRHLLKVLPAAGIATGVGYGLTRQPEQGG